MALDWDRALTRAEDFLRRHWKSKAVREAERRRRERRAREAARRIRRGAAAGLLSGAGVVGYSLAVAPAGSAGLIAAGAAVLLALAWPARRRGDGPFSSAELGALAGEAEEWLLVRRAALPGRALPDVDSILCHLGDLQPHLERIDPRSTLAWEARWLVGDHLPRLVDAWCDLPGASRAAEPELADRLVEALATLEDELARLCREIARPRQIDFEARGRFIESRYKEDETLRGD